MDLSLSNIDIGSKLSGLSGQQDLSAARDAAAQAGDGELEEAAKQFESLLATVMIKEMRRGLKDGFFGSGAGSDVFEGWLDEHMGSALAATGALDVAGFIRVNMTNKAAAANEAQGGHIETTHERSTSERSAGGSA